VRKIQAPGREPRRWLQPFAERDFRLLWLVGLVLFVIRWLEMLVMAVFAYQRTGSPFIVALLTMLRLLPMGVLGAFLGAWADRLERRSAMVLVVLMQLVASLVLALLAYTDVLAVWHLAAACVVNGIGWATDNPVRRMMIGEVVGTERMGAAMAIDVGTNNASRMLGPMLGGILLAGAGIAWAFAFSAAFACVALVGALALRHRNSAGVSASGTVLVQILNGLRFVKRDRRLCGVLVITAVYNLFGWPFTSMVPVIGHDSLQLGPKGVGLLTSMDGVGALAGAIAIGLYARSAHYARLYVAGVVLYLAMLIVFALAPNPLLAGAALLLTGAGGAAFSILQATLAYLAAPPEMRSRVLGVVSVVIGLGPIGFIHLGLLADTIGAPSATAAMGCEGLLVLLLTRPLWRAALDRPP
jgi:MFS family permease